ncbi:hypothetical protein PFLmoz3_06302 [Pseudomonas fluorescens]|uniref:Uncharacterized protein n=1 Tax=Pseudomonas fluorescens TaxID=294 RepID=A0A109KH34_PSEFL|nr:hypothetical protein PFLmoz3_06302 [Pseudomonas fluorescens]
MENSDRIFSLSRSTRRPPGIASLDSLPTGSNQSPSTLTSRHSSPTIDLASKAPNEVIVDTATQLTVSTIALIRGSRASGLQKAR